MTASVIPFPSRRAPEPRPLVYVQAAEDDGWFEVIFQAAASVSPLVLASFDEWDDADELARDIARDQDAVYPDWTPSGGDAA